MSWTEAGFELAGEHVRWADLTGNALSLAVVGLAMRKTIWTWPVQIAGAALLFAVSVSAHVPGNALKQVLIVVIAAYGWLSWSRGKRGGDLQVRPASPRERLVLAAVLAGGTLVTGLLFINIDWLKIAWSPWANAYLFVGSAVAMYAQSRSLVDFWIIWVLVDLVGVPLALKSGLYVSGVVYGIFFVLVLMGFRNWLLQYRRQQQEQRGKLIEAVAA